MIYIFPECSTGNETGHLRRSLRVHKQFNEKGVEASIVLPKEMSVACKNVEMHASSEYSPFMFWEQVYDGIRHYTSPREDIIFIFDKPVVERGEVENLKRYGKVVGMDPGGEGRENLDYVIDTLPNLYPLPANGGVKDIWLLDLPQRKRFDPDRCTRVLISIGGEDLTNVAESLYQDQDVREWLGSQSVDVTGEGSFEYWNSIGIVKDLRFIIPSYDLVITHFGVTAFEALATGVPVLIVPSSEYNESLAKIAKLPLFYEYKEMYWLPEAYLELKDHPHYFYKKHPRTDRNVADVVLSWLEETL